MLEKLFVIGVGLIGLRTLFWHLQNWQLREYRLDRLRVHYHQRSAMWDIFNLWFFSGKFPRPQRSGRLLIILLFSLIFIGFIFVGIWKFYPLWVAAILAERLIFMAVFGGILVSKFPVWVQKKRLFAQAKKIIEASDDLEKIIVTGSFGKSSTKNFIVHLAEQTWENVLYTPENNNHEIAIARLIIRNQKFFATPGKKYFVVESGAYKRGEIDQVCQFLNPTTSVIVGLSDQHLALFGSRRNTYLAKTEPVKYANQVILNTQDPTLAAHQNDAQYSGKKVIPKFQTLQRHANNQFNYRGHDFSLAPGYGEFFVTNAVLALETIWTLGGDLAKLRLDTCASSQKSLLTEKLPQNTIIWDLYSQNPDGVRKALETLRNTETTGQKIFVGKPLLELGDTAEDFHREIFETCAGMGAMVFWEKSDFLSLGKNILGQNISTNITQFQPAPNDVILVSGPIGGKWINRIKDSMK